VPYASYSIPDLLESLHIEAVNSGACYGEWIPNPSGGEIESLNPAAGQPLARVLRAGPADYECVMAQAQDAFLDWRMVPAPRRGEIVRQIANELRAHKAALGALVSLEMGKILAEGLGEVQEMIDIADFAVGLSRQLYGLTMHSGRWRREFWERSPE
jgi:aldehyde dehydrogenase (NAD+)